MQAILRVLTCCAASALCVLADPPPLAPEVNEFLAWYKAHPGTYEPPLVLKNYAEELGRLNLTPGEVKRRMDLVQGAVRAMPPQFTALHFDRIYSQEVPPFRSEANQLLVRIAEGLKPGEALDVAMGQGRNSLYLAGKGWKVTGYDLSEQGLAQAEQAARKAGLTLSTVRASHEDFDYGTARWDLIVQTYSFTKFSDDAYRRRVIDALKPGGVLLIEGFGGGPKNAFLEGFKELRVMYYESGEDVADWGMRKAPLLRFVGRKD
jgi:SAM-dependent methyltransferase